MVFPLMRATPSCTMGAMTSSDRPVLSVNGLGVSFRAEDRWLRAVDDVAFSLYPGRTLALVGESGSGKSVTSMAVMGLLPGAKQCRVTGKAMLASVAARARAQTAGADAANSDGRVVGPRLPQRMNSVALPIDLLACGETELRRIRGRRIAMIFQEPMTSLNPLLTVGRQIAEAIETHTEMQGAAAWDRAVSLMDRVGIVDPARRASDYPHRLSGGMRQRVMIAMALACDPDVLIADEPTTALDVTVQKQILELLKSIQHDSGMAMLLITHDLSLVAEVAHEVAVMYAGRIVEAGDVRATMANPIHPYSQALLACVPRMGGGRKRLKVISGTVPPLVENPTGCRFEPRCERGAGDVQCRTQTPVLQNHGETQSAACWKAVGP